MKYRVYFPATMQMSPIDYIVKPTARESKEEQALWHYNRSREHDGYAPMDELPRGTRFEVIEE